MRRVLRPLMLTALVLLLSAQVALGAKPIHEKFVVDETFEDNLCGIEVTTRLLIKGNVLIRDDGTVLDTSLIRVRWTNADGDWVTNMVAGPFRFTTIENADGTVTFRTAIRGVHSKLRTSEGLTAAFDRGRIIFETTVDLNDPEDPEDDVVISDEIVFQAGPHPEADSGFTLFCDVIQDALG